MKKIERPEPVWAKRVEQDIKGVVGKDQEVKYLRDMMQNAVLDTDLVASIKRGTWQAEPAIAAHTEYVIRALNAARAASGVATPQEIERIGVLQSRWAESMSSFSIFSLLHLTRV